MAVRLNEALKAVAMIAAPLAGCATILVVTDKLITPDSSNELPPPTPIVSPNPETPTPTSFTGEIIFNPKL